MTSMKYFILLSLLAATAVEALNMFGYEVNLFGQRPAENDHSVALRSDGYRSSGGSERSRTYYAPRRRISTRGRRVYQRAGTGRSDVRPPTLDAMKPANCRGSPGMPGAPGMRGPHGQAGPLGQQGREGRPGNTGLPGFAGDEGQRGQKGDKGKTLQGLPGKRGVPGTPGDYGRRGDIGERGSVGPPGDTGLRGMTGDSGSPGRPGLPGLNGQPGTPGSMGEMGAPGKTGHQGTPGRRGPEGKDGTDGDKGNKGLKGIKGEKGDEGTRGARGEKGIGTKGNKGDKGNQGIQGPKGKPGGGGTGLKGSRGAKGDSGMQGDSIEGVPGSWGDIGQTGYPGSVGDKGKEGDKGNDGTGAKGDKGRQGPDGDIGLPGAKGSKGANTKGDQGDYGKDGEKGDKGYSIVVNGIPGDKGSKGHKGPKGYPGQTGHDGTEGDVGMAGPTGDSGIKGNFGAKGNSKCKIDPADECELPFVQGGQLYTRHYQQDKVPFKRCPVGHNFLWSGYSLLHTEDAGRANVQDLGAAGSCIRSFMPTLFLKTFDTEEAILGHQPAQSYWLSAYTSIAEHSLPKQLIRGNEIRSYISRCAVCMARGPVLAFHSQTAETPDCPVGKWTKLWDGYSFVMHSVGRVAGGQRMESPGSCLPDYRAHPFIECNADQSCFFFSDKMSYWLMANPMNTTSLVLPSRQMKSHVSRCVVCANDELHHRGDDDDHKFGE